MRRHYAEILEQLKTYFPVPVSNPVMDGYFVHTVSRFLDKIDTTKSSAPVLGGTQAKPFVRAERPRFPERMDTVEALTEVLVDYCQGMPIWSHPNAQVNVVPPPTITSITAFIGAAIYNPNIIWDEYSARFADAEIEAIGMLADLVGYDPKRAGGVFTFGGTGTNLYGCKLAIEKVSGGQAMAKGLREDVKLVTSEAAHYSKLNVAGWLGMGTDNLVAIPVTHNNEMSLSDLESYLREALSRGDKVAAIVATMGTTDAFGIDDIGAIVDLRDRLVTEYRLPYIPHVHADAVIGWVWSVFRDYDFKDNPLGFHARTLRSLRDSLARIGNLDRADSIGVDLHKTGYAPYISSAIIVRDRADLALLSRESEEMPYLYQFGHYQPGIFTLECSRSGASALAALSNMRLLGKEGYRVIIGHVVQMAEMLREQLEKHPAIKVVNDYNYGPVTLFRAYPDNVDAEAIYAREREDPEYREALEKNNAYNRLLFDKIHERAMRGEGVLLSWTNSYQSASYAGGGPIAALKSFIMSPWTDIDAVTRVVNQVLKVREELSQLVRN
jgi:glutamate/tyrosine decarboxylase-like PLP-dependent enzyme